MIQELKPKDKRIVEIGIRPGEKLHETLISPIESVRALKKKNYFVVLPQIELREIRHTYKLPSVKKKQFRYSSDQGPYLSKVHIRQVLKKENIIN